MQQRYILMHGSVEGDYSSEIEIIAGPFEGPASEIRARQDAFLRDLLDREPHLADADFSALDLVDGNPTITLLDVSGYVPDEQGLDTLANHEVMAGSDLRPVKGVPEAPKDYAEAAEAAGVAHRHMLDMIRDLGYEVPE